MNKKFTDIAKKSKVIVIKVGSNILVNDKHSLRKKWLGTLVSDVQKLQKKGSKGIIKEVTAGPFIDKTHEILDVIF